MMKTYNYHTTVLKQFALLIPALFLMSSLNDAHAQWVTKWLNVGDLHNVYSEAGGLPEAMGLNALQFPATRPNVRNLRSVGTWITATNWKDENGDVYPVKMAHVGPRELGIGQVFPEVFNLVGRFERPRVYVDGLETFEKPVVIDVVDPSLPSDRMIHNVYNTGVGVTVERKVYAWSQEYHDNYHIWEITLTNTGNIDDDDAVELSQTLEGVYYYQTLRHNGPSGEGFGNYDMNDIVTGEPTDEIDDYEHPIDFRGWVTWPGHLNRIEIGMPTINPHWMEPAADTVGRLRATQFSGRISLHADVSASDQANDPLQPSRLGYVRDKDGKPLDMYNKQEMAQNYEDYVKAGVLIPHHADIVQPFDPKYSGWKERFADQTADPGRGVNGYSEDMAFGPYTLAPGESVRIVFVHAMDGISTDAAFKIGRAYKEAGVWANGTGGNKLPRIEYDANGDGQIDPVKETLTKNEWFMSGRDSLFNSFRRARANFQAGFHIPQPPQPPSSFSVQGGTDQIMLEWETFAGESDPQGGWEIYRGRNLWQGAVEDEYNYELIASPGPGERSFVDTDVTRGIDYYYYILAVGDVNDDPTGFTPTGVRLKSSRHYTQTFDPVFLKRQSGSSLEAARVVPNPFHLGADQNIRWPDKKDKIGFLEIPGNCTIRIYTELGELLETIRHTDGSGDEYWDMTTSSTQLIVSGIYMALITDEDTGEQIIRSFVVIR